MFSEALRGWAPWPHRFPNLITCAFPLTPPRHTWLLPAVRTGHATWPCPPPRLPAVHLILTFSCFLQVFAEKITRGPIWNYQIFGSLALEQSPHLPCHPGEQCAGWGALAPPWGWLPREGCCPPWLYPFPVMLCNVEDGDVVWVRMLESELGYSCSGVAECRQPHTKPPIGSWYFHWNWALSIYWCE